GRHKTAPDTAFGCAPRHRAWRPESFWSTCLMFHSPARRAGVVLAAALAVAGLGACSSIRSFLDPANIEYRGAAQGPELDVPPDLVTPQGSERYALPDRSS